MSNGIESVEYISSFQKIKDISTTGRNTCYGTILYKPKLAFHSSPPSLDWGKAQWPRRNLRDSCCRILLVSGWTSFRWGFPGGGIEASESPSEAMTREFQEEIGIHVEFTPHDYCFSGIIKTNKGACSLSHIFCKITDDIDFFQSVLASFEQNHCRDAYVNEVFSVAGLPLFFEGGDEQCDLTFENNTFGLTRYLVNMGGAFTPTLSGSNRVRDQFILLLLKLKIIDLKTLSRLGKLANKLEGPKIDLDSLLKTPGIESFLHPE